jgi:hypothetical protein
MTRQTTPRRRFIRTAGVALSAPLAAAAVAQAAPVTGGDELRARLARLEDLAAIRALTRAWLRHLEAGDLEAAAPLFADPSRGAVEGLAGNARVERASDEDGLVFSEDGRSAKAMVSCTVAVETPLEPDCTLVEMAQLQGGGVARRVEGGVLELEYLRRPDGWRIARVVYRAAVTSRGHFRL